MDPFALVGIIAVVALLAYAAAAQHYGKRIRRLQQNMFSASLESTTRFMNAAMDTLVEDYGHERTEAVAKLLKRCTEHGMKLAKLDEKAGTMRPLTEEGQS